MENLDQMLIQIYKIMGTDEYAEAVAQSMWNIYQKLKEKGFTEEQALSITLHFAKAQTK